MPLYMRIPKRGFFNHFANEFGEINLGRIQAAIDAGKLKGKDVVTEADLVAAGLVRAGRDGVRLLGHGALTAKIRFEVAGASKAAVAAVEKAGGSVKTHFTKTVHMNKKGEPGKRVQRRKDAADKRAKAE
jgi:large subunit ribosomal protein L15